MSGFQANPPIWQHIFLALLDGLEKEPKLEHGFTFDKFVALFRKTVKLDELELLVTRGPAAAAAPSPSDDHVGDVEMRAFSAVSPFFASYFREVAPFFDP